MPEITNNTKIDIDSDFSSDAEKKTMIEVKNVGMTFNMASEQLNNLKEYFLAIVKHNLFFEELRALEDINFEVKQGDVFGIVGTNGSGKSTLLKIVAGVLEPTNGSIEINGDIAPLIELGAGFDMELSARENIYLNGALLGHPRDFIDKHFDAIVEFSEIEKFLDMPMKNYSSGMIARIAFAIATVIVPEILIVDEVLSVGDFMFQKKCEDKILDLIKNHNTTVLIVSHSNDQIKRLCNKAIWIEKGQTRMVGDAETVCGIYGLVGGREGSLGAETQILDSNKLSENENPDVACQIAHGSTYPEVCLSLDRLAGQENVSDVFLVSHGTHLNIACSNAFAGQKNAPVISYADEKIDFHIIDWLEGRKPENIFILDAQDKPATAEFQRHEFSWNPKVLHSELPDKDAFVITLEYFDEFRDTFELSKTALVTNYENYQESSVLCAGLCSRKSIPYFCVDLNDAKKTEDHLKELKNRDIKELVVVGKNVSEEVFDVLKNSDFKIVDLTACDLLASQEKIHKHIHNDASLEMSNEAVIVPNVATMHSTAAACGYYSHQKKAHILVVDNTDLDSIAYASKFIEDNKIERLTFLGGPGELSKTVVEMLSRMAAHNQLN